MLSETIKTTKPFLRGTCLRFPSHRQIRRSVDETIQARKRKARRRKDTASSTKRGTGVLTVRTELPESVKNSIFGSESQDDLDIQILQSSDTESDDDISEMGEGAEGLLNGGDVTFEEIASTFPFELDKFQTVAIKELLTGKSVVVCAPTGAGKTAIADAAAIACLTKGKKVIYTTPLKALSNQKLYEFRQRLGDDRTGLVTGDTNIQTQAPVIIMTTEILRNMFYEVNAETPTLTTRLDEIGLVVLDEVHYLGDPGRGSVWEELIVGCPKHIQMLCMSATVANPQDLGDWISQIHGPCSTIRTSKRPVPLSWYFGFSLPKTNRTEIHPLLNKARTDVNPVCLYEETGFGGGRSERIEPASRIPVLHQLIHLMERQKFLPAIFFIFSRADCDRHAEKVHDLGVCLTTPEEQAAIKSALDDVKADQPEAIKTNCEQALISGIATHHAGCLPAWKLLVESLFQAGYLKVVFATGTLAAGINMPARTTVICALSKRIDGASALIGHNELLQMAGRAGRRGYDTAGNCVLLQSRYEGAAEAVSILRKGTEPLTSQFTTGYSFVLNLLAKFTMQEAKDFLEKSFQNYMTGMGLDRRTQEIKELQKISKQLRSEAKEMAQDVDNAGPSPAELRSEAKEAAKDLGSVLRAAREERGMMAHEKIKRLHYPFPILIDTTKNALGLNPLGAMALSEGIVMERLSGKPTPQSKIYCLGSNNIFYRVPYNSVVGMIEASTERSGFEKATSFALSPKMAWSNVDSSTSEFANGNTYTAKAAFRIPSLNKFERLTWSTATDLTINAKTARAKQLKKAVKETDRQRTENASSRIKHRLRSAQRRLAVAIRLKQELERQKDQGWNGFTSTMEILIQAGALDEDTLEILPLGHVTRELFGDNQLWMAMVFTHPSVQLLKPSLLAALASTLVAPAICTKPALSIQIRPPGEIEEVELLQRAGGECVCVVNGGIRSAAQFAIPVRGHSRYRQSAIPLWPRNGFQSCGIGGGVGWRKHVESVD